MIECERLWELSLQDSSVVIDDCFDDVDRDIVENVGCPVWVGHKWFKQRLAGATRNFEVSPWAGVGLRFAVVFCGCLD